MINISLPYIWELSVALEPLSQIKEGPLSECWFTILNAHIELENFAHGSVFSATLRSSVQACNELLNCLASYREKHDQGELGVFDVWTIKNCYSKYKIALQAEMGALPSYFATQKGGFDTSTLLFAAERLFPAELIDKCPESLFDIREAAKCLAFDRPTAVGFHIFRALEAVLRRYYRQVTGEKPAPRVRSIGVYVKALRSLQCGDEKILSTLDQLVRLHRNPLIHPDDVLTLDDAISIVGLARSAILAMLAVLPIIPPTTLSAAQSSS